MIQPIITNLEPASSDMMDDSVALLGPCEGCAVSRENNILRSETEYWKAMHRKAKDREEQLIRKNSELEANVKKLEGMLFGRSSEKGGENPEGSPRKKTKRKRGQQKGSPGHGRRKHGDLPVREETYDLPDACCPHCRKPYIPFFKSEDSDVIEIEVKAHIRRVKRKSYTPSCECPNLPAIITAKGPDKLLPKSMYGESVWIEVLIDKFFFYNPTYRLIRRLESIGLYLPQGTLTDGLKRLEPLFEPVYEAIAAHSRNEHHFHADETGWMVFIRVEGKNSYKWCLWVFKSADAVVYILDPSRSAKVPEEHLAEAANIILSVDRYSTYKAVAKARNGEIVLAFCWAHVRRDFLTVCKGYPNLEEWASDWVGEIGNLYFLNGERRRTLDHPDFKRADKALRDAVRGMAEKRDEHLGEESLHPACKKILTSMKNHWDGLTVFVDHPEIPMDNNAAESALRGPVVGKKNFYGSGAEWSGCLAAMMFTIFQTLCQWGMNPRTWLECYFRACAENGSKAPDDLSGFLPWEMDEQTKEVFWKPPPNHDTG